MNNMSVEDVMRRIKDYVKNENDNRIDVHETNANLDSKNDTSEIYRMDEFMGNKMNNNLYCTINTDLPVRSHRKIIGRFITLYKRLVRKSITWALNHVFAQQNTFNQSVTRSINDASNFFEILSSRVKEHQRSLQKVDGLNNEMALTREMIQQLDNEHRQIAKAMDQVEEVVHISKDSIACLEGEIERIAKDSSQALSMTNELAGIKEEIYELRQLLQKKEYEDADSQRNTDVRLSNTEKRLSSTDMSLANMMDEYLYLSTRMKRLEKTRGSEPFNNIIESSGKEHCTEESVETNFDYVMFGNRYRGSEEDIKNRQTMYLQYFENRSNVLDIGCGRGEFLGLLREKGIQCTGVEMSAELCEICKRKGLNVVHDDALHYLLGLPDNSLDGIFISHVVEHLAFKDLVQLLELCYIKLKDNSYMIIETPNPKNLAIYYNFFYLDPTHIKPVHPDLLKFILGSAGFTRSEFKEFDYSKVNYQLPLLSGGNIDNINEVNEGINVLNNLLFGYQDYTIITNKS